MNWTLIVIPVISALIGWFMSWIAIKLLFRPKIPKKIIGITFQGIFYKRQHTLFIELGKLITEIFTLKEIEEKISDPANIKKLLPLLETHVDIFLREKLTAQIPMIGMLIGDKTIGQVKGVFMKELEELFPVLMKQYIETLQGEFTPEKIINNKIEIVSSNKLEEIINRIMSTEFKLVRMFGAVLGFIIGVLQILITITLL